MAPPSIWLDRHTRDARRKRAGACGGGSVVADGALRNSSSLGPRTVDRRIRHDSGLSVSRSRPIGSTILVHPATRACENPAMVGHAKTRRSRRIGRLPARPAVTGRMGVIIGSSRHRGSPWSWGPVVVTLGDVACRGSQGVRLRRGRERNFHLGPDGAFSRICARCNRSLPERCRGPRRHAVALCSRGCADRCACSLWRIGKRGWERSRAWIWLFSSTLS